jgi:glycosyltransferase involved in cell wall biosynthesis
MIRILHFAHIINRNDFIHTVLEFCDPHQFEMSAATLEARGTLNADPRGIPLTDLAAIRPHQLFRAVFALRTILKRERIDILHAHHYTPGFIAMMATRRLPVALVMGRHYSDALYRLSRGLRRRAYLSLEATCNRRAAAIVVPARAVESVLLAQGVDPARVVRIPYGFAFERYVPPVDATETIQLWGHDSGLKLATFARLHPEKGHAHLLEALAELTKEGTRATWVIAGDGPARPALERLVEARKLKERVRFLGWRTDVMALMAAADVIVQPTLHEAFSQAMVEAMALGRPLVISDVSGVRDVVEDGETGLVVPPGDSPQIAGAIKRLRDRREAERIGQNARRAVRESLDIRTIATRYAALYRAIVERRAR